MSAPTFLIDPHDAAALHAGDSFVLDGPEGHHAASVQRLRAGERIDLVDGRGRRLEGRIGQAPEKDATTKDASTKDACVVLIEQVNDEPPARPAITAVQAIAKGDRGELAVQMLTEAGIDVIIPWQAEHSIAKWAGERGAKHLAKWQATAREAAKQSRRARVPTLEPAITTAAVADLIANAGVTFVLDEQASVPLTSIDVSTVHDVLLVIGPEGGLSATERAVFAEAGADLVRLGSTVLRTSTAGVAALSVVMAHVGRW
ncbi:MAG TPA: 16S rRNA (uracil(1498)-N(3))-methyltransferase [Candidatus Nanopelagicales bacterium]|nr:16S rRNA (uracil(1498)-N(3))-methyltransferase [Candidatus Nanopelagicales bacterium]